MKEKPKIAEIVNRLKAGDTVKAGALLGDLWKRALKTVYAGMRMNARPAEMKRLLTLEEEIAGPEGSFNDLDLGRMTDLFRRGDVAATLNNGGISYTAAFPFNMLAAMAESAEKGNAVREDEVELWVAGLKVFLRENGIRNGFGIDDLETGGGAAAGNACPQCGLPVQAAWTFCPNCECVPGEHGCTGCGQPLDSSWKRCPACGCPSVRTDTSLPAPLVEPIVDMTFVFVPGGGFAMGDETGDGAVDETPAHTVELDGFYMGTFPVTQGQWRRVMDSNPAKFQSGDEHPVEQVSFEDARMFIRRLAEMNGGAYRFRLPTEAEWEYAARSGGKKELYAGGDDAEPVAWSGENSGDSTRPVGRKRPNGLSLHDMSGNVWEWCEDIYSENAYRMHARRNPLNVAGGADRVIRGGNWKLDAWSCRCTRRFGMTPEYSGAGLGFRLVVTV